FSHEGVAPDGLEGRAGRVGRDLVIAGNDPHLASMFQANLGGAKNVPSWMKRHVHIADLPVLTVLHPLYRNGRSKSIQHQRSRSDGAQVSRRPLTEMVRMRVRYEGLVDGVPGVDVKAAGLAPKPVRAGLHQGHRGPSIEGAVSSGLCCNESMEVEMKIRG